MYETTQSFFISHVSRTTTYCVRKAHFDIVIIAPVNQLGDLLVPHLSTLESSKK